MRFIKQINLCAILVGSWVLFVPVDASACSCLPEFYRLLPSNTVAADFKIDVSLHLC